MNYSWKYKLECVNKYKNSEYIDTPDKTRAQHKSFLHQVKAWVKRYDDLGVPGLKRCKKHKIWTPEERFEIVAKVLAGNSITSVSKNCHISIGQLYRWVTWYNEKGIDGLQCKQGRPTKTIIMKTKSKSSNLAPSEREELKLLREKNKVLEMENEYLKKLDALVTQREAAEARAKKQK